MFGGPVRRVLAGAASVVAALATAWAALIFVFGGIDATPFGRTISSNEPLRPLLIAALAGAMFFLAGGDADVMRRLRTMARTGAALAASRRANDIAAIALALAVLAVGVFNGSRAAAGSDSFGYLSEVELILEGRWQVTQPWVRDVPWPGGIWTFSPLGYKPASPPSELSRPAYREVDHATSIVPTYSPGLPLLMAAAKRVAGNSAMFWIVPLAAAVLVLSTYAIGVRLGSPILGTAAAWLVATSPTLLTFELMPMTDVPIAAAWTLALWCVIGESIGSACGGALALAIAMLIRPNLAPLMIVLGPWLGWRIVTRAAARGRHLLRAALVIGGAAAGLAGTAMIYWAAYGTPFESGYGPAAPFFALSHFWPNAARYARWLSEAQTPLMLAGVAALCLTGRRFWPDTRDRPAVVLIALVALAIWIEFCFYLEIGGPDELRFLLPAYPAVMLGLAAVARAIARMRWRGAPAWTSLVVVALGLVVLDGAQRSLTFERWHDGLAIQIANEVRRRTPDHSVVLSMQHSGSIQYYGGRVTMRWDSLPAEWLDRSVAWMAERGVRTYALLEPEERDGMRRRFAGQRLADRLDAPAVFTLEGRSFYDLSPDAPVPIETEVVASTVRRMLSQPPLPWPEIKWH